MEILFITGTELLYIYQEFTNDVSKVSNDKALSRYLWSLTASSYISFGTCNSCPLVFSNPPPHGWSDAPGCVPFAPVLDIHHAGQNVQAAGQLVLVKSHRNNDNMAYL
jgi:hypothetical protein